MPSGSVPTGMGPTPFRPLPSSTAYFGADSWSPIFDFYNIELEALGQKLIWRENSEPPNMTTQIVREFCLPYVEKVIRATNSSMRTVMDSGSWGEKEVAEPREILDVKMDMMTHGNSLKSLRPFFLLVWNEDYEVVGVPPMRAYAEEKKVCLMLNVRPDLIEEGPIERIVGNIVKLIVEGAGKGRFALLINLVPVGTPVEHAHAAVAAIKQFGAYPVGSLDPSSFKMPSLEPFDDWMRREGLPV